MRSADLLWSSRCSIKHCFYILCNTANGRCLVMFGDVPHELMETESSLKKHQEHRENQSVTSRNQRDDVFTLQHLLDYWKFLSAKPCLVELLSRLRSEASPLSRCSRRQTPVWGAEMSLESLSRWKLQLSGLQVKPNVLVTCDVVTPGNQKQQSSAALSRCRQQSASTSPPCFMGNVEHSALPQNMETQFLFICREAEKNQSAVQSCSPRLEAMIQPSVMKYSQGNHADAANYR